MSGITDNLLDLDQLAEDAARRATGPDTNMEPFLPAPVCDKCKHHLHPHEIAHQSAGTICHICRYGRRVRFGGESMEPFITAAAQ